MMNVSDRKNKVPYLKQRAIGAYLGLAIGDALGASVEFMTPREIVAQYKVHNKIIGGGWLYLKAGQVTDDTEMSLALGDAIIKAGKVDAPVIAQSFSDWMARKPVDMGNTVRRGIVRFRQHGITEMPESEHDAGNGACMRTLPIALFGLGESLEVVRDWSQAQAHITHHNKISDAAILCVIEMIQTSLMGTVSLADLQHTADRLIADFPIFAFDKKREENPSGYIVDTIKAVFQSLFETNDFESCLIDVVNRGGDADTTGAIAGMIAGAFYGRAEIPQKWLKALDDVVKKQCIDQAETLIEQSAYYRSLS
ncbi:MAG: ADP-ribosyl-[dinitrogen reductase] hydrolase [Methylocystaceae bacterium]|nr:ADP-ribosyl-[dinitrogen reductase] hydrolase [Methylocystaceae bacterium]